MQIVMTYAQAQKHILDVGKALAASCGGDVVMTLPGEWGTEPPTEPGWYWCWDKYEPWLRKFYKAELTGRLVHWITPDDSEYIDDTGTHWLGPLPEPEPPTVDDPVDVPSGAVPSVAGAGGVIFDDD